MEIGDHPLLDVILEPAHRRLRSDEEVLLLLARGVVVLPILVGGTAFATKGMGNFFRRMQSGFVPAYLLTFGCGALVLLFIMLSLWKESGS